MLIDFSCFLFSVFMRLEVMSKALAFILPYLVLTRFLVGLV